MHPLSRPAALAALAMIAAAPATAQRFSAPQMYGGLSVGTQEIPRQFQSNCSPGSYAALEGRAGARSGALALEVRGALVGQISAKECLMIDSPDAVPPPPPDGVREERLYDFADDEPTAAFDARLRFGPTGRLPVVVSVGAGRLAGPGVPYVLASVGARTPGRLRIALDVERNWYRVAFDDVTREWQNGQPVEVLSTERRTAWWNGTGIRIGLEADVF